MAREMLKLRKGDSAIMIKADGQVELAGVQDKALIDDKGNISPVILFAAAWAKKDHNLLNHLVDNFRVCVREGYFGTDAQDDFKKIEDEAKKIQEEKKKEEDEKKANEKFLEDIAKQGQDPKVKAQIKKMSENATDISVSDKGPTVGNVTIDEGVENETK